MPLQDSDILQGKLAIGRQYLTRQDALKIAQEIDASSASGRSETFSAAAMRLGFLQRGPVDDLLQTLNSGSLVCRGTCGAGYPLAGLRPQETVACRACGGPLYVQRSAAPTPGSATEDLGQGGQTLIDLDASDVPPPLPEIDPHDPGDRTLVDLDASDLPPPVEDEAGGGGTFLDLEAPSILTPVAAPPPDPPSPAIDPAARKLSQFDNADPSGTFLDLDDDFDEEVIGDPDRSPPPPGDEAGEATLEVDQETIQGFAPGVAFEPFGVGHLRVVAPIGRGATGAVYRAQDPSNGRVVAVKILEILSAGAKLNDEIMERFRREVLVSARLDHPNLVDVYEAGRVPDGPHEGLPFYSMEYVAGRDLSAWREANAPAISACVGVVRQICEGMNHAHGHGVIHRDLKPSNVLLTQAGQVRICDFGLAKSKADMNALNLTRTGDILGTPGFMPAEQALGQRTQIGPPTDTYAIGAILFFLLTGRAPFRGPSAFSVIDKVVKEPAPAPSSLNPSVPAALDRILLKALEKQPAARFHTCSQLAQALAAFG